MLKNCIKKIKQIKLDKILKVFVYYNISSTTHRINYSLLELFKKNTINKSIQVNTLNNKLSGSQKIKKNCIHIYNKVTTRFSGQQTVVRQLGF